MKKLGLVIVLLCLSMAVSAGGFMFKHLEVKDGLSSNRVNDIFKDSEGFMWFATASGLNRYDGCQMKVYRSHNLDLGPLPDNCVQKVQEDGKKRLWIRTAAGYTIYDSKTESFNREKSTSLKFSLLSSALNKVFTPVIASKRYFLSSLTNPSISRGFVIKSAVTPSSKKSKQFTVKANT